MRLNVVPSSLDDIREATLKASGRVILFPTLCTAAREPASFDAAAQLAHLEQTLNLSTVENVVPVAPVGPVVIVRPSVSFSRFQKLSIQFFKIAVAVAFIVVLGWRPTQRLMYSASTEAIVNARIVTLRAPIEGTIADWASNLKVGGLVTARAPLFKVENPQTDRGRVDDLQRAIDLRDLERRTAKERLAMFGVLRSNLEQQVNEFQEGRLSQLRAKEAEYGADLEVALDKQQLAEKSLDRTQELAAKGIQTAVALERSQSDGRIAALTAESIRKRIVGLRIESEALERGFFVGDNFNDVPTSVQKLREVDLLIAEYTSKLTESEAAGAVLKNHLAIETSRFESLASGAVTAPASGQVWELLVSPGEAVRRGQDLMRILDCREAIVTAAVDEATYNTIWLGQHATFRFRGEKIEHEARIAGLNGLATVPSNFAILQNSLLREPYHVTVELLGLNQNDSCHVGRTGTVIFTPNGGAAK